MKEKEFKRILVVSRRIQSCKKAIQQGVSLAQKYNAELNVLHSVHNPFSHRGWSRGDSSFEKEYERLLTDTHEQLSELIEAERTKGVPIKESVQTGEPAEVVLQTVEKEKIDLLVMIAHEEVRAGDFFYGFNNEKLIRKMPCSIMLVKKDPD